MPCRGRRAGMGSGGQRRVRPLSVAGKAACRPRGCPRSRFRENVPPVTWDRATTRARAVCGSMIGKRTARRGLARAAGLAIASYLARVERQARELDAEEGTRLILALLAYQRRHYRLALGHVEAAASSQGLPREDVQPFAMRLKVLRAVFEGLRAELPARARASPRQPIESGDRSGQSGPMAGRARCVVWGKNCGSARHAQRAHRAEPDRRGRCQTLRGGRPVPL